MTDTEQLHLDGRTLTDQICESNDIIGDAILNHRPTMAFALVSGGNDSSVVRSLPDFGNWKRRPKRLASRRASGECGHRASGQRRPGRCVSRVICDCSIWAGG